MAAAAPGKGPAIKGPAIKGPAIKGPAIKGWCPGALRPMVSGDGLLVRVRPRAGAFTGAGLRGIATLARAYGNGSIDVTRRANLQLRGVAEAALPAVQDGLAALGLLDASPDAEAVRNVIVTPYVHGANGPSILQVAAELEAMLTQTPEFWDLPGKFLLAVDDTGGALASAGADLRVRVFGEPARAAVLAGDGTALTEAPLQAVRDAVARLIRERLVPPPRATGTSCREAPPPEAPGKGLRSTGAAFSTPGTALTQVWAAFGRMDASALAAVADAAGPAGAIRPTPWRSFSLAPGTPLAELAAVGWILDATDPLLAVDACPGAPACASAHRSTRDVARALAPSLAAAGITSAHISGCAKGCARSRPADLVLTATPTGWGLIRNGRADAAPVRMIAPEALAEGGVARL